MNSITQGKIEKWEEGTHILLDIDGKRDGIPGTIHYNPSICWGKNKELWVAIRSCITQDVEPLIHKGVAHPMHYINYLNVGKIDPKTLKVSGLKEIKPKAEYDGHQWGLEDVRLFWREDGLHGIGVALCVENGSYTPSQHEILIDYDKGTYTLLAEYGNPNGTPEKNWSPTESPARLLDFAYSISQIVLTDGETPEILGEPDTLQIHNGTQLLPLGSGFIQLAHVPLTVEGQRTYVQLALLRNHHGVATHRSQFWVWGDGYRQKLDEIIEFASGLVWLDDDTLLASVGLEDEFAALYKIPLDRLKWTELTPNQRWYRWGYLKSSSSSARTSSQFSGHTNRA